MPIVAGAEDTIAIGGWSSSLEEFFTSELPIIEEKMKELNPQLVAECANDSDAMKIVKYNNYLAKHIFDDYLDYAIWVLRQKSEATGRAIKTERSVYNGKNIYTYWLDRGIIDTDECSGGSNSEHYIPKADTCEEIEKSLEWERSHLCLYPDGFEENKIEVGEDEHGYTWMWVNEESVKDNLSRDVYFRLQRTTGEQVEKEYVAVSLAGTYHLRPWEKSQEFRNGVVQDIKDGMLECKPAPISSDCKFGTQNVFCNTIGIRGNISDWRSSRDYFGTGGNFSYSYVYEHK